MAEYASVILMSALIVTLFFGGWLDQFLFPVPHGVVPSGLALNFLFLVLFLSGSGQPFPVFVMTS